MTGAGLIVVNPPWTLADAAGSGPALARRRARCEYSDLGWTG